MVVQLLRIPHLIVCVNKRDLEDYSQEAYDKIVEEYKAFASKLDVQHNLCSHEIYQSEGE